MSTLLFVGGMACLLAALLRMTRATASHYRRAGRSVVALIRDAHNFTPDEARLYWGPITLGLVVLAGAADIVALAL